MRIRGTICSRRSWSPSRREAPFSISAGTPCFRLLADSGPPQPTSRLDIAFGLVASLIPFLPAASFAWISITAVGLYLLFTSPRESKTRAAGIVLLALSFNGLWGPQFFDFFAFPLLRADTALVGAALSLTQPGISWHDTLIASPEHSIVVYGPCSSFHNISLSLLCWVALTKLVRPAWAPGDALVAFLVCAAVVVLNTTRLYIMALGPSQFAYWHTGFGADLFAWTTPAVVIAVSLWGALRRVSPT